MAKFSKAHYVILARVFRETAEFEGPELAPTAKAALNTCKLLLMDELQADNPKFDATRFLKASSPAECPNPDVCGCQSTIGAKS